MLIIAISILSFLSRIILLLINNLIIYSGQSILRLIITIIPIIIYFDSLARRTLFEIVLKSAAHIVLLYLHILNQLFLTLF